MKILLSAYACEPNKGSEPGVGWNWALALVRRGHQVWVITRKNNQQAIELAVNGMGEPYLSNLSFTYYDPPKWVTWWKKGRRGVHLYYLFWQIGAYFEAKRLHVLREFDLVHHITFVSVRQPSFMGFLGIPFIFGPVAGGESAPWKLIMNLSWKSKSVDLFRSLVNSFVRFDLFMWLTFYKAKSIYVTSEQTLSLIPKVFHNKSKVQLAIAVDPPEVCKIEKLSKDNNSGLLHILYVGQFLHWKGMHLGLNAFSNVLKQLPNVHLTLVGHGPEEVNWRDIVDRLEIKQHQIDWYPWLPQEALSTLYQSHDVFLFPSLRDSGGMVVLEALSYGLPVICLKLGGPGAIVDDTCGRVVVVDKLSQEAVVNQMTEKLLELLSNSDLLIQLSNGAKVKADSLSWDKSVENIYASLMLT